MLLLSPFFMPKQEVHSFKETCLSLSASHSWKKREVQCSMGTRGTRSGASSEWDKDLVDRGAPFKCRPPTPRLRSQAQVNSTPPSPGAGESPSYGEP